MLRCVARLRGSEVLRWQGGDVEGRSRGVCLCVCGMWECTWELGDNTAREQYERK